MTSSPETPTLSGAPSARRQCPFARGAAQYPPDVASTRIADHIGRVLGSRYRLAAAIGTGASAHVFLAEDVRLGRRVAVKVLHPALADDAAFLRRFRAEARAAAALSHPNVMAVYDWGEEPDGPYIVAEFLGGGSLRAMLDRGNRLSLSQALLVGLEAARGLDYAHRRGLVHRDIKPANLLFDDDGRLRIADFGLARALAEAAWTEPTGAVLGTARYAAPEQVRGTALDGKADVYALALVLVEAVTGRVPFAADTTVGTIMSRLERPLEVPPELGPLAPILARAGQPDPARRPDAMALGTAIHALTATLPAPAPLPLAGPAVFDEAEIALDPDPTEMGVAASTEPTVVDRPAPAPNVDEAGEPTAVVPALEPAAPPATAPLPAAPVPAAPPKTGRPRRWSLRVALAVLVALAASAVLAVVLVNAQVPTNPVPDVRTQPVDAAKATLTRLGLEPRQILKYADDKAAGLVIDQSPPVGTKLKEGKVVVLTVSNGPTPQDPPDLSGKTQDDAVAALQAAGLHLGDVDTPYSETVGAGVVMDWNPKNGTHHGDAVNLQVSAGPQPRILPDLTTKTYDQAAQILSDMGLNPVQDARYDDDVPEGKIIGTRPAVGLSVPRGTTVTIVLSKGRPVVPNLNGMTEAQAKAALEAVGLKLGNVFGLPGGSVFRQTVDAGSRAKSGTAVSVFII
jgi:serine/threonine-protein kinase